MEEKSGYKQKAPLGRGGGQVVSVVVIYSDDLSLNPAESYSFSVKFVFGKNENKQMVAKIRGMAE